MKVQKPLTQVGLGDEGEVLHRYRALEPIQHTFNQFFLTHIGLQLKDTLGDQLGYTPIGCGGLTYHVSSAMALSGQHNSNYNRTDSFRGTMEATFEVGSRMAGEKDIVNNIPTRFIPNTDPTNLLLTPGITVNFNDNGHWYLDPSISLPQDINRGLEPGIRFLTGFGKLFSFRSEG